MLLRALVCGETLRETLPTALPPGFWQVERARGARDVLARLATRPTHLLLVDIEDAGASGLELVKTARGTKAGAKLGIVVLGSGGAETLILEAYAAGIDDFIVKPVDARELNIRARAVVKRRAGLPAEASAPLTSGGVTIDASQRLCRSDGRLVALQPREFQLLEALIRNEGRVLSRSYLLQTVWAAHEEADTRAVDVAVARLRRKLGEKARRKIVTISKLGYCFRPRGPL